MSICSAAQAVTAIKYWDGYYEKASSKYVQYRDKQYFEMDKGSANMTYMGFLCQIQGGAWCAMTVSTAIYEACGNSKADAKKVMHGVWPYAACNQMWDAAPSSYKGRRGKWTPIPGDVIIFSRDGTTREHTGMVIAVSNGKVTTQEGNASNRCHQLTYSLSDSYIYGYVRPLYSDAQPVSRPYLSKGDKGNDVKDLQEKLIKLGYDLGVYGADGDFGDKTDASVRDFQSKHNLTVDGEAGEKTMAAIKKALAEKESGSVSTPTTTQTTATVAAPTMSTITEGGIWDYLYRQIGNEYGVAGLLGNLYWESGLVSTNLQNSYESILGYTDLAYTAAVDNGSYKNFVNDAAGFGLAQWTYNTRKQALLSFAKSKGTSIGDPNMQLEFLVRELKNDYPAVWKTLTSAASVSEASNVVLKQFERPLDQSASMQNKRASYGQKYYEKYATKRTKTSVDITKLKKHKTNYSEYPELKKGAKNNYVKLLQEKLIEKGYNLGIDGADGDFGSLTDKAVRQYQGDHGLEVDGEVGQKTWKALFT